jgi:hypothetical protein
MNPEFQRNLWLEFSARRAIFMAITLGLIFLAGNSTFGLVGPRISAEYIFYAITVVWGARNAARAVVGEIRERTWDAQRLSALTPFEMTWGKLLGATCYAWFGGVLCLLVLAGTAYYAGGIAAALAELSYFVMIGLMAQSVALFTSLLAIRRRQTHSRLDVFIYQAVGLIAAWGVWWAWQFVSEGGFFSQAIDIEEVGWWGLSVNASLFYLLSLLAFLAWALVGCYRLMRLEFSMQNTPAVWTAFAVFMTIYFAGQEGSPDLAVPGLGVSPAVVPLLFGGLTLMVMTYVAAFAEPKDRVLYRWLVDALTTRRYLSLVMRLQAWMIVYAGTMVIGLVLAIVLIVDPPGLAGYDFLHGSAILTALGLFTRDIALFLVFPLLPGARRGDFPAVVTVGMLYGIAPQLARAFGAEALFLPFGEGMDTFGPLIAWAQAAGLWFLVYRVAGNDILAKRSSASAAMLQPEVK